MFRHGGGWNLSQVMLVFLLICFKLLTFSVNKSHVSLSVMLNLVAHAALYTGCFFTAPTQKSVAWVGPVYLLIFSVGGASSILRTFLGGTSKKTPCIYLIVPDPYVR